MFAATQLGAAGAEHSRAHQLIANSGVESPNAVPKDADSCFGQIVAWQWVGTFLLRLCIANQHTSVSKILVYLQHAIPSAG